MEALLSETSEALVDAVATHDPDFSLLFVVASHLKSADRPLRLQEFLSALGVVERILHPQQITSNLSKHSVCELALRRSDFQSFLSHLRAETPLLAIFQPALPLFEAVFSPADAPNLSGGVQLRYLLSQAQRYSSIKVRGSRSSSS